MSRVLRFLLPVLLPVAAFAEPPVARANVLHLTLPQAVQQALAQNFSIELQKLDPQIARESVRSELGRFDPNFNVRFEHAETTQDFRFSNGKIEPFSEVLRTDRLSSGISGVTSWGTEYDIGYAAVRNTGSAFELYGPEYSTRPALTLTQPLLRGSGSEQNLTGIRIARNNVQVSEWQLRRRIIDVVTTTEFVFHDLELAIENLAVAERSRELARQLFTDNESRVKIGVSSPLDVSEARAEVASREEQVILSQRRVLDNENLLKQLVTRDMLEMLDVRVKIQSARSLAFQPNVRAGVADALALRPDYRQAILDLEQRHIRLAFQKGQLLPRIDLTGSLELLGLGHDFGGSTTRTFGRDQTDWSAGLIFSIPLGNRQARGAAESARLEVAKALVNLQQLEQQIVVDVDNAAGQIVAGKQRVISTREARRLALESLQSGQERLKAGSTTTFEVLQLQTKLTQTEAAEALAQTDLEKAISEYRRQTGTTLREHQVELK